MIGSGSAGNTASSPVPSGAEGRVARYLLYAIGEIALVVIGILIALQINNWNEYRRDRVTEKELLQNIAETLEANVGKLQGHLARNKSCDQSSKIILAAIDNKLTYNDSLDKHFGWSLTVQDPGSQLSFVGYESLKDVGIEIILDKQLKKEILNLFEETYQVYFGRKDQSEQLYIEITKLRQERFLRQPNFRFSPFDYEHLITDKYFYSWLLTTMDTRGWINAALEESLRETQRVLQLVRDELN